MIFVLLNLSSDQRYRTTSALGILQVMIVMPQSKSNRFDLANFMKARKDTRQKAVEQSKAMKTELNTINRRIKQLKKRFVCKYDFTICRIAS